MVTFTATIKKFGDQGEKTGWHYIEVPVEIAEQIKPHTKKGYRVKGNLDKYKVEQLSLLPMGGGNFIIPLNVQTRKSLRKSIGGTVTLQLAEDKRNPPISAELLECLSDEPVALKNFQQLTPSHQRYFSTWIESAKTDATKAKRIAKTIEGLTRNMSFGETLKGQ